MLTGFGKAWHLPVEKSSLDRHLTPGEGQVASLALPHLGFSSAARDMFPAPHLCVELWGDGPTSVVRQGRPVLTAGLWSTLLWAALS